MGGGPSGVACGIRLLHLGKSPLIVDSKSFPRTKLCAGLLTGKSKDTLRLLLGDEEAERLLSQARRGCDSRFALYHQSELLASTEASAPITTVDRPEMDAQLIQHYKQMGGALIEGDGVVEVDFEHKECTLHSGRKVGYGALVVCDGAASHVEHLLAKHDKAFKPKTANALCMEVNVDREDLPEAQGIGMYLGIVPDSYCWSFS